MVDYPICPKCETNLNNNIGHFYDYFPDGHGKVVHISIDYCTNCGNPITAKSETRKR